MRHPDTAVDPRLRADVQQAARALRSGGVILYPTDTIWGLGCDATNPQAVERLRRLKGRGEGKSMLALIGDPGWARQYATQAPEVALQLMEYATEPLTLVLPGAAGLAPGVAADDGTVGLRVPKHPFCQALLAAFGRPVVSTSANTSGQPAARTFSQIEAQILQSADYVALSGRGQAAGQASRILKIGPGGEIETIR